MPVRCHLDMLATQFLANAMQPHHPSHAIVTAPPGPHAHLKPSLQSKFGTSLEPYLTDGVILPINYKKVENALHTSAVKSAIDAQAPNRVLGTKPHEVSTQEGASAKTGPQDNLTPAWIWILQEPPVIQVFHWSCSG